MDTQTIKELRAIAKERGLHRYSKLKKADLIAFLEAQVRPPRRPGQKRPLGRAVLLPKPEEMDLFELQEMKKTRSVVKSKLKNFYDYELITNFYKKRIEINPLMLDVEDDEFSSDENDDEILNDLLD